MAAASPSPAAVLAAVAVSRPDDGWFAARALLMLHPTPGPWRSALPQIERLLAGRPGETLLSAFAEVPATAVRRLVRQRAVATGVPADGEYRAAWLDLLDASERQATEHAQATAQTLRLGNDGPAIAALLGQIAGATRGQRRRLFDSLAATMAAGLGAADAGPGDRRRRAAAGRRHTELAEALPGDDPPPPAESPEPAEARRLQVRITDAVSGKARIASFRPGAQHTVAVTLSPEALAGALVGPAINEGAVAFVEPEGGGPATAALTVQFVSDAFGRSTTVIQPITLPLTGSSSTATFDLIVAATATTVSCSVLLFQGPELLQSAVIKGPVSARDRAVDGAALRIVSDGEFVSVVGPAPALSAHPVQSSISTHVGRPGEAVVTRHDGRTASVVDLPDAATQRGQITEALRMALDVDAQATTAAGRRRAAAAQVRLMRSLARFGNLLYERLPADIQALSQESPVQLICGSDDIVPFEIVYDYGFPTATARLCANWLAALSTGACDCRPVVGATTTICPLGFWGLRLVIERQVADSSASGATAQNGLPSPGRTTLLPMDRVLFAASQKVDAAPGDSKVSAIADTVAVLTERLGRANVSHVKTWATWRSTIERTRPGLILSLPHNDRDRDDLPRLEIGRGRILDVGALDRSYVLGADPDPAQVGPVVFLLGCNTANEAVPWYSAASAFRRRGAAVVVGTLSEALGRQTAPMTRMLADLLWGAPGAEPIRAETLGDIMLLIRRRLVAEGMTLGMSLVAFGHAGWMLSPVPSHSPIGG